MKLCSWELSQAHPNLFIRSMYELLPYKSSIVKWVNLVLSQFAHGSCAHLPWLWHDKCISYHIPKCLHVHCITIDLISTQHYLMDHSYANAETSELWEALDQQVLLNCFSPSVFLLNNLYLIHRLVTTETWHRWWTHGPSRWATQC